MKNCFVISKAKAELVLDGVIAPDENIYTKNAWRKQGYKVDKEASPITTIPIYIYAPHTVYEKDGKVKTVRKMLNVKANFYKQSQVTVIQKGA